MITAKNILNKKWLDFLKGPRAFSILSGLVLITGVILFGFISVKLRQDKNVDLRNYHYYNVYALLNHRLGFDYQPACLQSYHNPVLDLPFYFLVTHLKPKLVGFLMGAVQGLNFWLLFRISAYAFLAEKTLIRLGFPIACALAGMFGPINMSELGTVFNDNLVSILVFTSLIIIMRKFILSPTGVLSSYLKSILAAGLIMGLGVGFKLTSMIYVFGPLGFILLAAGWKERIKSVVTWGLGLAGGFLISAGYWMYLLWKNFQNPLFPYYNKIFKSPYYLSINFADERFFPKNALEWIFFPFYLINTNLINNERYLAVEIFFSDIRLAILYGLIILAAVVMVFRWIAKKYQGSRGNPVSNNPNKVHLFLIIFFVVSYMVWLWQFAIYRYAVALEMLAPLLMAILLFYLIKNEYVRTIVIIILFTAIIFYPNTPKWGRAPWSGSFFGIKTPHIDEPEKTVVVMAGTDALAYVIPALPKSIRFVRLDSNLTKPGQEDKMQSEMREILLRHNGPIYLMSKGKSFYENNAVLIAYNLRAESSGYLPITAKFDTDIRLFPVTRIE